MSTKLAKRTASLLYQAADALVTTLEHNAQTFDHSRLVMAATLIEKGYVHVQIHKLVTSDAGNSAMYLTEDEPLVDQVTGEVVGWIPGNVLYLSAWPSSTNETRALLAHEAVHLMYDILGVKQLLWDNEALAFYVQSFILARLNESAAKRFAGPDNLALIGCLASDFYNSNPRLGAVSSSQFNKKVYFDYTAEGGKKGAANPYTAFTNIVMRIYPKGIKNGKKTKLEFNGIW